MVEKGNIVKTVPVDEVYALELQKKYYELDGYKKYVEMYTVKSDLQVDDNRYSILLDRYIKANAEYGNVWDDGITAYIAPEDREYNAEFSFNDQCFVLREVVHADSCPLCVR